MSQSIGTWKYLENNLHIAEVYPISLDYTVVIHQIPTGMRIHIFAVCYTQRKASAERLNRTSRNQPLPWQEAKFRLRDKESVEQLGCSSDPTCRLDFASFQEKIINKFKTTGNISFDPQSEEFLNISDQSKFDPSGAHLVKMGSRFQTS